MSITGSSRTRGSWNPFDIPLEFKAWLPDWLVSMGFRRDTGLPVGMSVTWRGIATPSGWYREDGSTISISANQRLYQAIGTTYNTGGEPAGTFRLPNTSPGAFTIIKA